MGDHTILVHNRGVGASAVTGEATEVFRQAPFPNRIALGVESAEPSVDELHVDVAGLGVRGRITPAHAIPRNRRMVDVEAALPELLAGVGIPTSDRFLAGDVFAHAAVGTNPAVDHDRRRTSLEVLAPDDVGPFLGPIVDQAGFGGDARTRGPRGSP